MSLFVLVQGPSTTGPFGADTHEVEDVTKIQETVTGSLMITALPTEREIKRLAGPSTFVYPRGGWTRLKIREVLR